MLDGQARGDLSLMTAGYS